MAMHPERLPREIISLSCFSVGLTQQTGQAGEQVAAEWLHANGFELLHRNWRSGRYELDIIARRRGVVHFVEVKTRRAGSLTSPEEAVTPAKCAALMRAAQAYVAEYGIEEELQFDLIAVQGEQVRYVANAVYPTW